MGRLRSMNRRRNATFNRVLNLHRRRHGLLWMRRRIQSSETIGSNRPGRTGENGVENRRMYRKM